MAELQTVARPYAEAAFEIAQDAEALPQWSQALKIAAAATGDPRVQAVLDDPELDAGKKEALLLSVLGDGANDEIRKFIRVLVEAGRVELLPQISELYEARKDVADNVARATIETAIALSDAQLASLKGSLARHFGKSIETHVSVDKALIGGARITVGDRVIDATVQGKLTTLANELSA